MNETISTLFKIMSSIAQAQKNQSESETDRLLLIDSLCGKIDELVAVYSREAKADNQIPEAIKQQTEIFRKLAPQKTDFSPLSKLANSIDEQNRRHNEIMMKLSQPQQQKQDNIGYESLVRESLAAMNKNNEELKYIADSFNKKSEVKYEEKKPISYIHKVKYYQWGGIDEITSKPI